MAAQVCVTPIVAPKYCIQTDCVFPELGIGNVEDHFKTEEFLGRGFSSTVYKCYNKLTNLPYACKMIAKRYKTFNANDVRHEVEIMLRLSGQQNVVTLCDAFEDSDHVFLIMDFCSGGDLFDFIALRHPSGCSEQLVALVMLQVMSAIRSCHAAGVMHGDIKPENIMLCGSDTNGPLLKLIDFGLSKIIRGEKMTAVVGTPCYMAPEVLQQNYGCESIYGVRDASCTCSSLPNHLSILKEWIWAPRAHEGDNIVCIKHSRRNFHPPEACKSIPKSARDVLSKMLAVDPSTRLTADEFFEHPWAVQHMRRLQRE